MDNFVSLLCLSVMWMMSASFIDVQASPCIPRYFDQDSVVCVCNATYCDTVEPNNPLPRDTYAVYTSSKAGQRMKKQLYKFQNDKENLLLDHGHKGMVSEFVISRNQTYQSILGFGGAFTDSTGINIASLSAPAADHLLKSYFSEEGLEYSTGRIPIASCDFSTWIYSYDDTPNDFDLEHFRLQLEDTKYKIPYIHQAQKLNRRKMNLFASPWSCPGWMKNSGMMKSNGTLIGHPGGKYYQTWAMYFVRFLEEYAKQGVSIWGITAQNEPMTGLWPDYPFQTLGFTAETQRDFVAMDLGPTLEAKGFGDVKIMVMDDQRMYLPKWPKTIMRSPEASKYVSGIAVHWYSDFITPPALLTMAHEAAPDKFLLYTEACEGSKPWQSQAVSLGDWSRFESYVNNIMEDLAHWVVGWTDWNMALDMEGGPSWVKNYVDSPIIVNKDKDEFYKQPMFYAMGHFSKFLPENSIRIGVTEKPGQNKDINVLAFETPDKSRVFIIHNRGNSEHVYRITDDSRGAINGVSPPRSLQTLVWW